jgi:hypothetical protein
VFNQRKRPQIKELQSKLRSLKQSDNPRTIGSDIQHRIAKAKTFESSPQPLEETFQAVSVNIRQLIAQRDAQISALQDEVIVHSCCLSTVDVVPQLKRTKLIAQLTEQRYLAEIRLQRQTIEEVCATHNCATNV